MERSRRNGAQVTRRQMLQVAGLVGTGTFLASCGLGTQTTPTPAPSAPAGKPFQGIKLRLSTSPSPHTDALKPLIPAFELETGATVEVVEEPAGQLTAKHIAEATAKTGAYDVITTPFLTTGQYAVSQLLLDLNPYMSNKTYIDGSYELTDVPQEVLKYGQFNDKGTIRQFLLPFKFDIYGTIYRKDIYTTVPKTYDDLVKAAKEIQPSLKSGEYAVIMPLQASGPAFTTWATIFRSYGGEFFDANKFPMVHSDAAVQAIEILRQLLPFMPQDVLGLAFEPALQLVAQGRGMYQHNWNQFFPTVLDPKASTIVNTVGFEMTPAGPQQQAQEIGGWGIGVSPDSKNKEAAFLLSRYLTSPGTAVQFALNGGSIARGKAATNSEVVGKYPYYPLLMKGLEKAVRRPNDHAWAKTQTIVGNAVNKALQPGQNAKTIMTEAAREVYKVVVELGFTPEKTGPMP